jgi:cobalt-zinc-cadmium efflux system outer membrane protein
MRSAVVYVVVVAACGLADRAAAGDRSPIDLSALLDEVGHASPQVLGLEARAAAARELATQREALPDPLLSATYTNDGLSELTLGSSEFTNLTVGWEQEVPSRTARRRTADVFRAEAEALRASSDGARARLRARVITLFAELWRLDHAKELLLESRALLTTAAGTAQARYESGEGIQEGLIRAQSAVRRVDLAIEGLSLERRRAEIALGSALGRAEDPAFGPAAELPVAAWPIGGEDVAASATASSPDVLEASAKERSAEARLEDARVQAKPVFSWLAAYQFRGGLDPMVMGGFSVRLPVWKNRNQARGVAGAEFERTAAAYDRSQSEILARSDARSLAAEVDSIDIRLRLYREAILPQAEAAFESANAAFASGRAEMFLVVDDLDRWVGARTEELLWSARRVEAIASLEAATGRTLFEFPRPGRLP